MADQFRPCSRRPSARKRRKTRKGGKLGGLKPDKLAQGQHCSFTQAGQHPMCKPNAAATIWPPTSVWKASVAKGMVESRLFFFPGERHPTYSLGEQSILQQGCPTTASSTACCSPPPWERESRPSRGTDTGEITEPAALSWAGGQAGSTCRDGHETRVQ